jgi:hypothetical protein
VRSRSEKSKEKQKTFSMQEEKKTFSKNPTFSSV